MKKLLLTAIIMLLCVAIIATGCAPDLAPTEDVTTEPTVLNDFTDPTIESETNPAKQTEENKYGALEHGIFKYMLDENGHYVKYEGDEMLLRLKFHGSGNLTAFRGTGILLFIDGQLQPYKTKDDDTYRYMHVVYPEDDVTMLTDLRFVPLSGKEGDSLDIYYAYIFCPDYSFEKDGGIGFVLSGAAPASGTRMKMEATPGELEVPQVTDRVISWSISKEPLTAMDTNGWTAQDFQTKCKYDFKVNPDDPVNQLYSYVWNISKDKPLKVRFEVWGNPFVHYGLVFFLDNQPVSVAPEDLMFLTVEEGYKTVVEAEIDMTGFDGEGSVYSALVPRNQFTTEILTDSYIQMAQYYLLFDECPLPDHWRE